MSINKGKLRIVFMGTPAFAVHILDGLVQKEYNIVGVVTDGMVCKTCFIPLKTRVWPAFGPP